MSTLLNIGDKIKAIFTPGIIADRFVLLVDSAETGTSNDDQFTLTGAEVSTGTTFPVTYAPKDAPYIQTEVTLDVSDPTITFPSEGEYYVQAGQPFNRIAFADGGDKEKVLEIRQWGGIAWSSMEEAFRGCSNMAGNATDVPDLSGVGIMTSMFRNASSFNQDIGGWDVSNVTDMAVMFFNSPFNQPIGDWDVSNVENMRSMFNGSSFNQPIGDWDVSSVKDIDSMFRNMQFNQDISGWDVSSVESMREVFRDNTAFNQPIGSWDVSSLTDMTRLFRDTTFNQDISGWDVSSVITMESAFRGSSFNQDISGWDVSSLQDARFMFQDSPFNQNLGSWNISSINTFRDIFRASGMSCENYTDTIVGWANFVESTGGPLNIDMTNQANRVFATDRSGGAAFGSAGLARIFLTGSTPTGAGWSITGDSVTTNC